MFLRSMVKETSVIAKESAQQRANTQAQECLRIAGIIMDDIARHMFNCCDIYVRPSVWHGMPGFIFDHNGTAPSKELNNFWGAFLKVELQGEIKADLDQENRAVAFHSLDYIPAFIDLFITQNMRNWSLSSKNSPSQTRGLQDMTSEDLLFLKRDSYLGLEDLEADFKQAQELSDENIFMGFRYLPHDLHRSLNAVKYVAQGQSKYPTWNVFRLQ